MNVQMRRYASDSAMPAHYHEQPWFCVLMHGAYEEQVESQTHRHRPGDLLFCPAFTTHAQRFGNDGALKLLFTASASSLRYLADQGLKLTNSSCVHTPSAVDIGIRLRHEMETDDAFSAMAAEALTLELLAAFGRDALLGKGRARAVSPPHWLRRAREMLDACTAEQSTCDAVAHEVDHHPVHLAREFRRYYGTTVGAYVRRRRAEQAADLLRSTQVPLTQIALSCGYGGSAQLSRSFRAAFGVTPSAYRSLAR